MRERERERERDRDREREREKKERVSKCFELYVHITHISPLKAHFLNLGLFSDCYQT